jgi:hypothetical protein
MPLTDHCLHGALLGEFQRKQRSLSQYTFERVFLAVLCRFSEGIIFMAIGECCYQTLKRVHLRRCLLGLVRKHLVLISVVPDRLIIVGPVYKVFLPIRPWVYGRAIWTLGIYDK